MIENLTPEQEQLMYEVRDEWVNMFISGTTKLDKDKATKGIKWLYEYSGLEEPEVLFVSSPLGVQYACNLLKVLENVAENTYRNIHRNVYNNVNTNVEDNVFIKVLENIDRNVKNKVKKNVAYNIEDNVHTNVGENIHRNVYNNVGRNVKRNVSDTVLENVRRNVWGKVVDNVKENVGRNVLENVSENTYRNIHRNVYNNVGRNVNRNFWGNIHRKVYENVKRNVEENIHRKVYENVRVNVEENISGNVLEKVKENVKDNIWGNIHDYYYPFSFYGNIGDSGWVAYYDFFERIGLDYKNEGFTNFKELIQSGIYDMVQLEGLCVACELPTKINREVNQQTNIGVLHSTTEPTIEWSDGYKQYYLWGVYFEQELWEKIVNHKLSAKEILSLENMEQRMAALKVYDQQKLFDELETAQLIDTHTKTQAIREKAKETLEKHYPISTLSNGMLVADMDYKLYEVKEVFAQTEYFVNYHCPSTGRFYSSCVDVSDMNRMGFELKADHAMAWKGGRTLEEYQSLEVEV